MLRLLIHLGEYASQLMAGNLKSSLHHARSFQKTEYGEWNARLRENSLFDNKLSNLAKAR